MEIVAEIGSVHDGSLGNALRLIDVSKECGATVAKFQLHIPEEETTKDAPSPKYFQGESRFEYFRRTSFTDREWIRIAAHCDSVGVKFGCSVFSRKALINALEYGVQIVKIPSGEVSNKPLLDLVSEIIPKRDIEVHLSTGMSNWSEIASAFECLKHLQLSIFQCTSRYPAPPKDVGLNVIPELKRRFGVAVGLSDHSQGTEMAVAAVTIGASLIEKHITFSRKMYGSDAFNALEPKEFKSMVEQVVNVQTAISNPVDKDELKGFEEMRRLFQKSIYVRRSIREGEQILEHHLSYLKPDIGISSSQYKSVIGKKALKNLAEGSILSWKDLEN